jgi:thiol-disulfide isomerase/thioredoxin
MGLGAALYFFVLREDAAETARAMLLDTAPEVGLEVGTVQGRLARDFLAYSPDGEPVRLSELRGKPTVINFWATWCTSCLAEMPDLKELQAKLGPDRLDVLAMNVGQPVEAVEGFLDQLDANDFRIGMDPTLVVADAYRVRGMPQSVFVDGSGVIRAVYVGQLDQERMEEYVAAAFSGVDITDTSGPLRFVTTVGRDRVLEVRRPGGDAVEFRSKSLRCDDGYCARDLVDRFARTEGVLAVERHLDRDPASILVHFDGDRTGVEALTDALARQLSEFGDPLYRQRLKVTYD